ncbi:MAG TPA: EAL domain-containing protein, partial [Acidimicrobiia bacterium]|nr:EAL domain-containing protein [Acidimicrobiia bacterium]
TGRERDLEMNIANRLDNRDVAGIVITLRDVTARRQLTRELERRAFRDDLTKLANRALFMDRLEVARYRSQRSGAGIAVLFIDLDDFKAVNDGLGHGAGDVLLCAVSSRLSQCLRPSDTIARLGGDEFAVLLEDVEGVQQVENTARRLLEVLQMPVEVGEMSVTVPASIGIALASDGASRSNLMRDADIALYRAKAIGKNRIVTFDATMGWEAHNRLQLRSQLESALADGALRVMYQPIVSIDSSRIVGVEALIRWEHPTMGLLLPEEFLPIAEDSGLITPIGSWVLHHACMDAAAWNAQGHDVYVSVNISARQLRESEFADVVQAALGASGLRADRLMLELTESVLIDERAGRNLVEAVAPLGVGVAIDDFGTGYSSLAYLQRFPVHVVKIDRTFISRINEHGARAVLKSMTAISDVMGYVSIAEGVESSEEASELMDLDYRFAQGFLWSEAVDAVRIGAMLSSDQPAPA